MGGRKPKRGSPQKKTKSSTKKQKLDVQCEEETENMDIEVVQSRTCPLPCREVQFGDILAFLENNIKFDSSG